MRKSLSLKYWPAHTFSTADKFPNQITIDRMLKKQQPKKRPLGLLNFKQLFVGGIPTDVTQEEITQVFKKYGKLKKIVVPKDKTNPNKNAGCAFISYDNCESVNAVFDDLRNIKIRTKEVP